MTHNPFSTILYYSVFPFFKSLSYDDDASSGALSANYCLKLIFIFSLIYCNEKVFCSADDQHKYVWRPEDHRLDPKYVLLHGQSGRIICAM